MTPEDEEKLIEIIKAHPVIYDTQHPDYVKINYKDKLYEQIGAHLNTDGKFVKEHWSKLRERHREALRRQMIKRRSHMGGMTKMKPWIYQRQMEFLLPFMRSKTRDIDYSQHQLLAYDYTSTMEIKKSAVDNEESLEDENDTWNPQLKKIKTESLSESSPWYIESSEPGDDTFPAVQNWMDVRGEYQNDALYQFFFSMYTTTKHLPKKFQRHVRNEILGIVSQAEEEFENQNENEAGSETQSVRKLAEEEFEDQNENEAGSETKSNDGNEMADVS